MSYLIKAGSDMEDEAGRLRADNQALSEELSQCQADKDFVWSLWKRLQVANPDITQAIGMVVEREKEKSELKDRKVLEILQVKDDKIEELHKTLSDQGNEMTQLLSKRLELQDENVKYKTQNMTLRDKLTAIEVQMEGVQNREQSVDEYHRKSMAQVEEEKQDLLRQVSKMGRDMELLRSDLGRVQSERSSDTGKQYNLESLKILEKEVMEKRYKLEKTFKDLNEAKRMVQRMESQNRLQLLEVQEKNNELETIRKELSELWNSHHQLNDHATQQAEIIAQLQHLQQDTQKMLKNQEDAYSIEATSIQQLYAELTTRYDMSKRAESDLRQEVLTLKKQLFEKDDAIVQLQHKLDLSHIDNRVQRNQQESFIHANQEPFQDVEFKIQSMQTEIDVLRDSVKEKNRVIDELEQKVDQTLEFDVEHLKERSHSTPYTKERRSVALSPIWPGSKVTSRSTRSRSSSPAGAESRSMSSSPVRTSLDKDLQKKLLITERKLDDMGILLKLRTAEIAELRAAHDKRLERLKTLQNNYKLVKEQLKTFEDEQQGMKKRRKLKKAHPKELQRENSDAVWNELAFYKKESKGLHVENVNIHEELDVLRVQTSQDVATIHELRLALDQEKEELEYQLRRQDTENRQTERNASELVDLRKEVQEKDLRMEQLEKELRETTILHKKLSDERRHLRAELLTVKQESAQQRIQMADLKRTINRMEKLELRGESGKDSVTPRLSFSVPRVNRSKCRRRTQSAKPYHKNSEDNNIAALSSAQEEFDEDGWEEISSETEGDTELTESDSLGRAIASSAKSMLGSPDSTESSETLTKKPALKSRIGGKKRLNRPGPIVRVRRPVVREVQCSTTDQDTTASSTDVNRTVLLRDRATSPISFSPPRHSAVTHSGKTGSSSTTSATRQLKPMKQRLEALQQQLTILRDSRAAALKSVSDLRETSQHLQSDLNLATQRLKMAKQTIQKVTSDLERVQREKEGMECRLLSQDDSCNKGNSDKRTEHEWKALENRLKSATFEVTRQAGNIRSLKTENESMSDQVKALQDRVNRVERDNSQKRTLLENHKSRLKQARDSIHNEATLITDLEAKVEQLTEANDKSKVQLDSAKKRLTVVSKEKRDYEDRFFKASAELEKKAKQLSDCQMKKSDLESAITELETTAQQQLHGLASQSEAAIDAAKYKLSVTHTKIQQFQQFVKTLVHELSMRSQQARSLMKQYSQSQQAIAKGKQQPREASLQRAQNLAKDILNISQSDIEDLMSVDLDRPHTEMEVEDEKRKDKKWTRKCEKLMLAKEDFVIPLVELIMEKVDERQELLDKLHRS